MLSSFASRVTSPFEFRYALFDISMRARALMILCGGMLLWGVSGMALVAVIAPLVQDRSWYDALLLGGFFLVFALPACFALLRKTPRWIKVVLLELSFLIAGLAAWAVRSISDKATPLTTMAEAVTALIVLYISYAALRWLFLPRVGAGAGSVFTGQAHPKPHECQTGSIVRIFGEFRFPLTCSG